MYFRFPPSCSAYLTRSVESRYTTKCYPRCRAFCASVSFGVHLFEDLRQGFNDSGKFRNCETHPICRAYKLLSPPVLGRSMLTMAPKRFGSSLTPSALIVRPHQETSRRKFCTLRHEASRFTSYKFQKRRGDCPAGLCNFCYEGEGRPDIGEVFRVTIYKDDPLYSGRRKFHSSVYTRPAWV